MKAACISIAQKVADGEAPPSKKPDDGDGGWLRPKEVGMFKKDPEQVMREAEEEARFKADMEPSRELHEAEHLAKDALAVAGLLEQLTGPSSVGELGAGAGAGGAAVRSPGLYKGGPWTDEHDRLAIRAIIEAALPHHLTKTQIATEAGTLQSSTAFKRKFKMYEGAVGRGWKCTEATATARDTSCSRWKSRGKQYEQV
jgi:hypothetical protein